MHRIVFLRSLVVLALWASGCGDEPFQVPPTQAQYTALDQPLDVSADGRVLAYLHYGSRLQPPGIYLKAMDPDSLPRLLVSYDAGADDPSDLRFAPDGQKVALVRSGFNDIDVLQLADSSLTRVTFTSGNARGPDWDPSGRYIVYERPFRDAGQPDTSAGLFIVDTITLQDRPLLQGSTATWGGWPRWSPDSTTIVYAYGSPTHILMIGVDGSNKIDRTPGDPAWSQEPLWVNPSLILFENWGPARRSNRRTKAVLLPGGSVQVWLPDVRPYGTKAVICRATGEFVSGGPDSTGEFIVLFVQRLDDTTGSTRRQITFVNR